MKTQHQTYRDVVLQKFDAEVLLGRKNPQISCSRCKTWTSFSSFTPPQARSATRQRVSPYTPMNGAVPSSHAAPRPRLVDGRTTLSVMEASVRMTGTDHLGKSEFVFAYKSSVFYMLANRLTFKSVLCNLRSFSLIPTGSQSCLHCMKI